MTKERNWDLLRRRRKGSELDIPVLGSTVTEGKIITAKFNTTCLICHRPITKGDPAMWRKGEGVWHLTGDCR